MTAAIQCYASNKSSAAHLYSSLHISHVQGVPFQEAMAKWRNAEFSSTELINYSLSWRGPSRAVFMLGPNK